MGLWNGLKSLAGYETTNISICWSGLNVNEVKNFLRFDEFDFSVSHEIILESRVQSGHVDCSPAIIINENKVCQQLKCLKTNKAAGPDGVHTCTFKVCAAQLSSVLHSIFLFPCRHQNDLLCGRHCVLFLFQNMEMWVVV